MSEHGNSTEKKRRNQLFDYLEDVLKVAQKKYDTEEKADDMRLKWGRLITQAVQAYGGLLDADELELRIIMLEEKLKDGILIEQPRKETKRA